MINIAIVENEKQSSAELEGYLKKYAEENGVDFKIIVFENGIDFLCDSQHKYDIVFMDIDMPLLNGMETAKKLRTIDENTCLIFTTNLAQFAVKGYEVDASAFLVKPIKYFDIVLALKKALKIIKRNKSKTIAVPQESGKIYISINDIKYVEVLGHYIIYHTADTTYQTFGSLNVVEKDFLAEGFIKPHRSYVVNPKYITEIKNSCLKIGDEVLPVSRNKKQEIMEKMMIYLKNQ